MKKAAFCFSLISYILLAASFGHVSAASCVNTMSAGSVSIKVPTLPSTGTYNIWTRMQSADDKRNRYYLEVNGDTCLRVGGSSLAPGAWTWVSFIDGDLSDKVVYDFKATTGNSFKLIGDDQGVKVDRVLVVKNDCVPIDLGSNCQSSVAAISNAETAGAVTVPSLSTTPVSGLIIPSQSITLNRAAIKSVEYAVDGKPISADSDFNLDTTLLSNGDHRVAIKIIKNDGTTIDEITSISVDNPQSIFSPIKRWERLNHKTLEVAAFIVAGLLVVLIIIRTLRSSKSKKRELTFRGF